MKWAREIRSFLLLVELMGLEKLALNVFFERFVDKDIYLVLFHWQKVKSYVNWKYFAFLIFFTQNPNSFFLFSGIDLSELRQAQRKFRRLSFMGDIDFLHLAAELRKSDEHRYYVKLATIVSRFEELTAKDFINPTWRTMKYFLCIFKILKRWRIRRNCFNCHRFAKLRTTKFEHRENFHSENNEEFESTCWKV